MKRVALSYWTLLLAGIIIFALHTWWWFARPAQRGEVVSGFGAAFIVLGVLIGTRPYLKNGLRAAAAEATTFRALVIDTSEHGGDFNAAVAAAKGKRIAEAMPALVDERVVAVLVVMLGTLFNGYGAPLVRVLGF